MNRRLRWLPVAMVALAVAALAVAACGSSTGPTSSTGVAGITATQTVPSTQSAPPAIGSSGPADTGPLASLNLPSFDLHAAPDLEAQLPSSIGGQSVQKYSLSLAQLQSLGQDTSTDQTFINWIHALGKNPSDVTMAVGTTSGTPTLTVGAIRVAGVDQNALASTFQQASQASNMSVTQATIGGKQVMKIADPEQTATLTYAYPKGDTLFFTEAADDSSAAVVLQSLP